MFVLLVIYRWDLGNKNIMYKILIIFCIFVANNIFAHGKVEHYKTSSTSKAKEMIDAGKKYHKNINIIRKKHPEFLIHKRDKTLRQGIRNKENSLKGCVNCHANKDKNYKYIPVNNKNQFCSNCHKKVGQTLDCFSCHRTTPSGGNR